MNAGILFSPELSSPFYGEKIDLQNFICKEITSLNITDGECNLSLNLEEKKAVVSEVGAKLVNAQAVIVAEYRGLEVGDMNQLRANARQSGVYFQVIKNSLARRVVEGTPFSDLSQNLVGPLAYCIGEDPVAVAKVLYEFSKDNKKLVIKIGAMPNVILSNKDINNLATMMSREELIAKLLGTMQAPIVKFVRTLNEVPTRFARGLVAVRDQK